MAKRDRMAQREATGLLKLLTSAFKGRGGDLDEQGSALWLMYVGRVPFAVGERCVESLIESAERFPSVAQWQETCRRFGGAGDARALPPGECSLCTDGYLFAEDGSVIATMREDPDKPGSGQLVKLPRSCPNGCKPGEMGRREEPVNDREAHAWSRHIARMGRETRFGEMIAGSSRPEAIDYEGGPDVDLAAVLAQAFSEEPF